MAIIISGSDISGIGYGGLNDSVLSRSTMGYSGCPLQMVVNRSTAQTSWAAPVITAGTGLTNPGTSMENLNLVITPFSAGNKVVLEWRLMTECTNHNITYVITRNGTIMADSADSNRWSGIITNQFDRNYDTTTVTDYIRFIDNSCLGVETTYRLCVRASGATARTLWMNSSVGGTLADDSEVGESIGIATEYKA